MRVCVCGRRLVEECKQAFPAFSGCRREKLCFGGGRDRGFLSCIFLLFLREFGVYAGVCVWMRTHTHLQRLVTRDVS